MPSLCSSKQPGRGFSTVTSRPWGVSGLVRQSAGLGRLEWWRHCGATEKLKGVEVEGGKETRKRPARDRQVAMQGASQEPQPLRTTRRYGDVAVVTSDVKCVIPCCGAAASPPHGDKQLPAVTTSLQPGAALCWAWKIRTVASLWRHREARRSQSTVREPQQQERERLQAPNWKRDRAHEQLRRI